MAHPTSIEQRQANGNAGEDLTKGLLGQHLRLSVINVDKEGADILCENPESELVSARRGILQAKAIKTGNVAYLKLEHAVVDGLPRPNFFALVHVLDAKAPRSYFLTSTDIAALPREDERARFYDGAEGPKGFSPVTDWSEVAERICEALKKVEADANADLVQEILTPIRLRAAEEARHKGAEYLLMRVNLLRSKRGGPTGPLPIVVARSRTDPIMRAVDARWDLFNYWGTFQWGYEGNGSILTAISILGHYFKNVPPSQQQFLAFYKRCIVLADEFEEHIITAEDIEAVIVGADR